MALNYRKNSEAGGNDSFWTSYSDLFLGLSTIFLLLYVTSSLRTGTDAIQSQVTQQKLSMQVEELQSQLKMYESIKNEYIQKNAAKDEVQEYQELMDKLTLLQEDATSEKERLARESIENEHKATALNKYQQMIRNVLNANKVAKSRINTRNTIIEQQDVEIDQQEKDIAKLNQDIQTKKTLIEQGNKKIVDTEAALSQSLKKLQKSLKDRQITKKIFDQKAHLLHAENERKVEELKGVNQEYSRQLNQASQQLSQASQQLTAVSGELGKTKGALAQVEAEAKGLQSELAAKQGEAGQLRGEIDSMKSGFAAQRAKEKEAFDAELQKQKMGAAEKARREGEFRAGMLRKEQEMQGKLSGLEGRLKDTEGALSKAKEEIDTRRAIAAEIQKGFASAGIKAEIDMQTGEVVLDFGETYFESDSAGLKAQMKSILEKAMPVYSKSLFGNPKVASKISDVEIIGFASPTYKGRFVDPSSPKPEDKAALKYNMDLSFRRANAIFGYMLEKKDPNFQHQNQLMSLMKVSGRSFLEVMKPKNRGVANAAEFCKVNDCKKAQRVIVRFSMDSKK